MARILLGVIERKHAPQKQPRGGGGRVKRHHHKHGGRGFVDEMIDLHAFKLSYSTRQDGLKCKHVLAKN